MKIHEKYINRCLQLAKMGHGTTSPNPSVGCVIVQQDRIIGEGFTSPYGGNHAEVNAIQSVVDSSLLQDATLYVSLEPCNHYGKTPPCTDLIINSGIKKIVIGCEDPNEKVAGSGIKKLRTHGCDVQVGILEKQCIESNKRFITYHTHKRPYILLKWAESHDGFIDVNRRIQSIEDSRPTWISNQYSRQLVHKWRTEEDAILVGTNTVLKDNPKLNVRDWFGEPPVRVILDRQLRIPKTYHVYDQRVKTILITEQNELSTGELIFERADFSDDLVQNICDILYKHHILSVLVEGGLQTLQSFIDANIWDESRVFIGASELQDGIAAPSLNGREISRSKIQNDLLITSNNS